MATCSAAFMVLCSATHNSLACHRTRKAADQMTHPLTLLSLPLLPYGTMLSLPEHLPLAFAREGGSPALLPSWPSCMPVSGLSPSFVESTEQNERASMAGEQVSELVAGWLCSSLPGNWRVRWLTCPRLAIGLYPAPTLKPSLSKKIEILVQLER